MTERDESEWMHTPSYLPRFPKPVSHTHTHTQSLSRSCLTNQSPGYSVGLVKNPFLSVKSTPLPYTSVSPSCALFVAVCSQLQDSLCAGLGGPVWNVVRRGQAGQPKRGCAIVPTHSIHPPLICRSLGYLGGQSKGCREMELRTLSRHTAIELTLHLEHTKWV